MKKVQLIEWGIITMGLIFGYKFVETIFSAIVQVFYSFQENYGDISAGIVPILVMAIIYAICFVGLIRKSSQIAFYIHGNSSNQENVPIKIGKKALLHVILICICIATIVPNLADILLYLFESFKQEAGKRDFSEFGNGKVSNYTFKLAATQTIIAVVILYFSKDISSWFIRKNEVDELTFDSNPEN